MGHLFLFLAINFLVIVSRIASARGYELIHERMEEDVIKFAREVERIYALKEFNLHLIDGCHGANFDHCRSQFPNEVCSTSFETDHIAQCNGRSSLRDRTISTIRIPGSKVDHPTGETKDLSIIQSVCLTRELDEWFVGMDWKFSDEYEGYGGNRPRAAYFGSVDGSFRIFPARQSEECNTYDPTLRPWFVAGSSGKKSVVIIIDDSMSSDDATFKTAQNISQHIISTLGWEDRAAIIATSFSDSSNILDEANEANRMLLRKKIDSLSGDREVQYFEESFEMAFQLLNTSYTQGRDTSCHSAVVFLTQDASMRSISKEEKERFAQKVEDLIRGREKQTGTAVIPFIVSISAGQQHGANADFLKRMACRTHGTFSRISNSEDDITDALSSYYRVFAHGLGSDSNTNFVAWTEPYEFATGGIKGVTVSAPVYDRSISPPLFVGVVGIDIPMKKLGATESHDKIKPRRTPKCPNLDFIRQRPRYVNDGKGSKAECLLESLRREEARCGVVCDKIWDSELITKDDLPDGFVLFHNVRLFGLPYERRTCCDARDEGSCAGGRCARSQLVMSVSLVGVSGVILVCCSIAIWLWYRNKRARYTPPPLQSPPPHPTPPNRPRPHSDSRSRTSQTQASSAKIKAKSAAKCYSFGDSTEIEETCELTMNESNGDLEEDSVVLPFSRKGGSCDETSEGYSADEIKVSGLKQQPYQLEKEHGAGSSRLEEENRVKLSRLEKEEKVKAIQIGKDEDAELSRLEEDTKEIEEEVVPKPSELERKRDARPCKDGKEMKLNSTQIEEGKDVELSRLESEEEEIENEEDAQSSQFDEEREAESTTCGLEYEKEDSRPS